MTWKRVATAVVLIPFVVGIDGNFGAGSWIGDDASAV